jgi:hypothetical protein
VSQHGICNLIANLWRMKVEPCHLAHYGKRCRRPLPCSLVDEQPSRLRVHDPLQSVDPSTLGFQKKATQHAFAP